MGVRKIECCRECKAPTRNATCHSYCQDYLEERAALDVTNSHKKADANFDSYAKARYNKRAHENNLRYGTVNKPTT